MTFAMAFGSTDNRSVANVIKCSLCKKYMGGSPGELSEELVTQEKQKKGWRMNCDACEAMEGLQNEL